MVLPGTTQLLMFAGLPSVACATLYRSKGITMYLVDYNAVLCAVVTGQSACRMLLHGIVPCFLLYSWCLNRNNGSMFECV